MAIELLANSPQPGNTAPLARLLAAIPDATTLSMSVDAPAPSALRASSGQFRVVVDQEIMIVQASASGASPWTIITRGAENSTPGSHGINTPVYHYLTAGAIANLLASSTSFPQSGISRVDFSGHSFMAAVGAQNGDSNGLADRFARSVNAQKRANIAVAGSVASWPTAGASGDGGWSWVLQMFQPSNSGDSSGVYLPRTTLAVMMNGNNDYVQMGATNSKPFTEALKTIMSRYCTAALFEDSDASWSFTGGSWSTATNNIYSGGTARTTTTLNQTATWSAPADYPGNLICAIGLAVTPGTPGAGNTLVLGVSINGVAQPNVTLNLDTGGHADAVHGKTNGIVLRYGRSDQGQGISMPAGFATTGNLSTVTTPTVIQSVASTANVTDGQWISGTGIPAGTYVVSHTANTITMSASATATGTGVAIQGNNRIALTNTGGTAGAPFTPDYAQIEADPLDGPVVAVLGEIQGPSAPDAGIATWNTATRAAITDFPGRTVYVDVDSVLNRNPALFATNPAGHPNNAGHAVIAQATFDTVMNSKLLTDRVLARMDMRQLGRYDGGFWTPLAGDYGVSVGPGFSNGWTGANTDFGYPGFRKDMQEHVFLRGSVNQPSTGVAASTVISPIGTNQGYQSNTRYKQHVVVVWTGSANQPGYLTVLNDNGLQLSAGGSNAAGNINIIEHDYMADYSL